MRNNRRFAVVIPALNEEQAIGVVLAGVPEWVDEIVVVDNGSTDATAAVARQRGAVVVREPRRGYGAACLRGLSAVRSPDVVVFLDADNSSVPSEMGRLVDPILHGHADLVIGSRVLGKAEAGSLSPPQRLGKALASWLLRIIWRQPCTDLGPFRAIRFDTLQALRMDDLDYGWTVQMQARALGAGVRVLEIPVSNHRRIGRSKISGTLRGVFGAGNKILSTIAVEWWRCKRRVPPERHLLLFTRFPEEGTTKTRLIPFLGADGAVAVQRDLTRHAISTGRQWCSTGPDVFKVCFSGGGVQAMQREFGQGVRYIPQVEGDLGTRMFRALYDTKAEGADKLVAIGADCPGIDTSLLDEAFDLLDCHDVVLGPAIDGGYYLIGMNRPHAPLFESILWGSPRVLRETLAACARCGLRVGLLRELSDVDEPADLAVWQRCRAESEQPRPSLSIVIPTLNEEPYLAETLAAIGQEPWTEVLVVDGGSTDRTCAIAEAHGARVLHAVAGRATQMNAGAAAAQGAMLLFLHADTRLPFGFRTEIAACLRQEKVVAGAFRFAVDCAGSALRLVELGTNLRSAWLQSPYGDQGIFLRTGTFHAMGGYADIPVMEDFALMAKLRREGHIALARSAAITSARRWLRHGVLRTTCLHLTMIACCWLGVDPRRLARWRAGRDARSNRAAGRRTEDEALQR